VPFAYSWLLVLGRIFRAVLEAEMVLSSAYSLLRMRTGSSFLRVPRERPIHLTLILIVREKVVSSADS